MKSMTGFGRGTAIAANGTKVEVEISSVNSKKQVEMRLSLPSELLSLDAEVRNYIQKNVLRGTLNVKVSYQLGPEEMAKALPINMDFARVVIDRLSVLARECSLPLPTIADVLAVPGVIGNVDSDCEEARKLLFQALDQALKALDVMREREGTALKEELLGRGRTMSALLESIIAREAETVQFYRDKLIERIGKLGIELPVEDERLAKEIAFYVDKSDITEETVRLRSHLVQYEALLNGGGDAGRNLDFLCQEMGREANTLSAKTTDTAISADALTLKIEISKVKEQIMNVE